MASLAEGRPKREGAGLLPQRAKARRTGPAIPAAISFSRPDAALPRAHLKVAASATWQEAAGAHTRAPDDVGSTTASPRRTYDTPPAPPPPLALAAAAAPPMRTRLGGAAAPPPAASSPDAGRSDQWRPPWAAPPPPPPPAPAAAQDAAAAGGAAGGATGSSATAPPPGDAPPRKVVRFAPGPLAPAAAARGPVGDDGHPAGEGRVAVPVRQLLGHPPCDLSRANIGALEELLGPENAPSLGRLKRRIGLAPAPRPPRVPLGPAASLQRRQAAA
ncbi:MAG: hypothetical protein J3K34DRAFT_526934 [Monoraphidium minutum]|nr:MAG: hypothetical protein J3K34DRAFT_526934 [Monoraphidium minutum]